MLLDRVQIEGGNAVGLEGIPNFSVRSKSNYAGLRSASNDLCASPFNRIEHFGGATN